MLDTPHLSEKERLSPNERKVNAETEKVRNANLDKILEAYEKAGTVDVFMQFMLKTSDMMLTKERAESDPKIQQYLKSNFKEQELGPKYEDFIEALPDNQDYEDNALRKEVVEAVKPKKTKIIPEKKPVAKTLPEVRQEIAESINKKDDESDDAKVAVEEPSAKPRGKNKEKPIKSGEKITKEQVRRIIAESKTTKPALSASKEVNPSTVEVDQGYMEEVAKQEQAQKIQKDIDETEKAYVKAYRDNFPKLTRDKKDDKDVAAMLPPRTLGSFFGLSKKVTGLEKLYNAMIQTSSEVGITPEVRKKISESSRNSADREAILSPEAKAGWAETNEADEVIEAIKNAPADVATESFLNKNESRDYSQGSRFRPEGVRYKSEGIRHDLIEAYQAMGVLVGEGKGGNAEEVLAKKPPFSYVLSAQGREVRRLYDQYVKKLEEEK